MNLFSEQPFSGTDVNCNVRADTVPFIGTLMPTDQRTEEQRRQDFGEWLKRHRDAKGISQGKAAELAGMSRTQYTRIELGESGTKRENIPGLARAVDGDVNDAYTKAGFSAPEPLAGADNGALKLLDLYRELQHPNNRTLAVDLIQTLWQHERTSVTESANEVIAHGQVAASKPLGKQPDKAPKPAPKGKRHR